MEENFDFPRCPDCNVILIPNNNVQMTQLWICSKCMQGFTLFGYEWQNKMYQSLKKKECHE
jgi:hypothetical protein